MCVHSGMVSSGNGVPCRGGTVGDKQSHQIGYLSNQIFLEKTNVGFELGRAEIVQKHGSQVIPTVFLQRQILREQKSKKSQRKSIIRVYFWSMGRRILSDELRTASIDIITLSET